MRCHYSSHNIGGSVDGVAMCWRRGTNPAPGDGEISVDAARADGMPCGATGEFFEDDDKVIAAHYEADWRLDDYTYWDR